MYKFGPKMKELKAEAIPDRLIANESLIKEFEDHIGVSLPHDYRSFLSSHSGIWLSAKFRVNEPTPFGNEGTIETIYGFMKKNRKSDDLYNNIDISEGAPVAIPIGKDGVGNQVFLMLSGKLRGQVYFRDSQQRYFWPDERFYDMFENLHPDIKDFLEMRKNGKIPIKEKGMENFYFVANSFQSFIELCDYWDTDAEQY
jgi:hypothetical protein